MFASGRCFKSGFYSSAGATQATLVGFGLAA